MFALHRISYCSDTENYHGKRWRIVMSFVPEQSSLHVITVTEARHFIQYIQSVSLSKPDRHSTQKSCNGHRNETPSDVLILMKLHGKCYCCFSNETGSQCLKFSLTPNPKERKGN